MKTVNFVSKYKQYMPLVIIFILSSALFGVASVLHEKFDRLMSVVTYLTWHNMFEFSSIMVCFTIFVVVNYTFEQTRNYKVLFFASVFLYMGITDFFHTFSFKGMPDFFVQNTEANRATTLWIASRLFGGIGLAIAANFPIHINYAIRKTYFALAAIVMSFGIFFFVTYCPYLFPPMYIEGQGLTALKIGLEYVIALLLAVTMFKFMGDYRNTKDYSYIALASAMLLNLFSEYAFISYGSVYDIYNYIGHVYKVIYAFIFFRVIFVKHVQTPYFELYKAKNQLKEHARNLDRLVEERTHELKGINNKLLEDLEYAKDIQKSLMPSRLPREPEVDFFARFFPAERVSGDFYNVFKLDDKNICIYIGDVSGHGVSAAMLTVFVTQNIKSLDKENGKIELVRPSQVLNNLYKSFNKMSFKEEVYIVMMYGIYNTDTKELTYASAGINVQPLIIDSTSQTVVQLDIKGFPICKLIDFYSGEYKDVVIKLNRGDKMIFYTDGLVEAKNKGGEVFSQSRLVSILNKNISQGGGELSKTITREVFGFMDYGELKDDITFVLMDIK